MSDSAPAVTSISVNARAASERERFAMRGPPPTLGSRETSTYTVLGFIGYGLATALASTLAVLWRFSLTETLVVLFAPPLAFLAVVAGVRALLGEERIVFYQTASAAVLATGAVGWLGDLRIARLMDVAMLGVGLFLVLGRLGCHSVACCHGRPATYGVVYGTEHVRVGFWERWRGRVLWPVQLTESAVSAILVLAGLIVSSTPGYALALYITGYGTARFALELVRGDGRRPYALGLSEAQWIAIVTTTSCAFAIPSPWTAIPALGLALSGAVLVARRRRRELLDPAHVWELGDALHLASLELGLQHVTSLGVRLSCHPLPDGRTDCVLSSQHPAWSASLGHELAHRLWANPRVLEGQSRGVIHVIEAART